MSGYVLVAVQRHNLRKQWVVPDLDFVLDPQIKKHLTDG